MASSGRLQPCGLGFHFDSAQEIREYRNASQPPELTSPPIRMAGKAEATAPGAWRHDADHH